MDRDQYIKTLKLLIKKYHPDTCSDDTLLPLFSSITIKLNQKLDQARSRSHGISPAAPVSPGRGRAGSPENAVVPETDQAYAFYRQGIKYYRTIHPDQFYEKKSAAAYEPVGYEEQLKALEKIFISFNGANYFFRKVVDEYPQSSWAADAGDKINLLKKLWKSYESRTAEADPRSISPAQLDAFMNDAGLSRKRR